MFSLNPLSYLLGGSTIALAIALGGVTLSKNHTIHELRNQVTAVTKERDNARESLGTSRANERNLEIRITEQNQAIENLRREGETRQKLLDALRQDPDVKKRSTDILGRKGETCEDADKLILELVR